jgi:hypothetical protein
MNKHIPSFDSFVNEARITWGEELAYNLNHDRPLTFVKAYEGQGIDIFFTKDGRSAIVTQRTSNLISHGKDAGKSMNTSDVKFVYCGLEEEFYSPEDYKKLLNAVYKGSRNPKVKPLNIQESVNEGAVKAFEMDFADMVKNIKSGYGWIDPEYVADTWENSSDTIDFGIVKDEIYNRLIKAGLLFFADADDEEKKGKKVTNISQIK